MTEPGAALVVGTSGSTGAPKAVVLSSTAVRTSARLTHERLGGPGHWHLALPAHYVAGVMVLVRALVAGTEPVRCSPALDDLAPRAGRNYLSVVPTQLVRAARDPELRARLRDFDAVLVGGAAIDSGLLARLRADGIRLVTTYGMAETSGGCVYDGVPLTGVEVRIGERGRVELTTPTAFSGYRLRPDLTAEVLDGHTVRTQDRGRLDAGRLSILGRLDDVVISGGVNVDLAQVEAVVRSRHPEAVVVAVPDPEWGVRLVALSAAGLELADLDGLPLNAASRPRAAFGHVRLPTLSTGKIDRRGCEQLARQQLARQETDRRRPADCRPTANPEHRTENEVPE